MRHCYVLTRKMKNMSRKKLAKLSDEDVVSAIDVNEVVLDAAKYAAEMRCSSVSLKKIPLRSHVRDLKIEVTEMQFFKYEIRNKFPSEFLQKNVSFALRLTKILNGLHRNPTLKEIADNIRFALQETLQRTSN